MSDSSGGEKILPEPLKSIGAQDLQKLGVYKSGFIRKKGEVERMISGLPGVLGTRVSHMIKWRQKYVTISQGCLYCFDDEYSKSPHTAYSLRIYTSVFRVEDSTEQMKYCFNIVPEDSSIKTLEFSCNCDNSRLEWMRAVFQTIKLAKHQPPVSGETLANASYEFLESGATQKAHRPGLPARPLPQLPTSNETGTGAGRQKTPETEDVYEPIEDQPIDSDSDDNPDYTEICEELVNELPPVPKGQGTAIGRIDKKAAPTTQSYVDIKQQPNYINDHEDITKKAGFVPTPFAPSAIRPQVAPKPKPKRQFSKEEYEYKGNDPTQAISILDPKPEGTFLVRDSRQGGKVLCARTEDGVKQFKIFTRDDGEVSIDSEKFFKDADLLLEHYSKEPLPKRTAKLKRGFSESDIVKK